MLKENKKTLIITSIITILPMLVGILFWNRLPDVMATHFGMNNNADGFTSKAFAVFGIPLCLVAIEWIGAYVTARDPKKQNISPKMFSFVLWLVPAVSLFAMSSIYAVNLGHSVDMPFIGALLVGLMLVIVGNYLPKARQNYTVGIKIPWTLDNEENWNRTHRFAGFLWVIAGILMIVLTLFGFNNYGLIIVITFVVVIVPILYSLKLHVQDQL